MDGAVCGSTSIPSGFVFVVSEEIFLGSNLLTVVRLLTCGRPVGHDGFRLVADVIQHFGDRLLSVLVYYFREIGGFDARKTFYYIIEHAVEVGDGLQDTVQRDKANVQDMFAYSSNRFPVHSGVPFFGLWFRILGRFVLWLNGWGSR